MVLEFKYFKICVYKDENIYTKKMDKTINFQPKTSEFFLEGTETEREPVLITNIKNSDTV